jgi:hypothetical protein
MRSARINGVLDGSPNVYINEGEGGPPSISGIAAVNAVMDAFAQAGVDRIDAAEQHDDDPGSDFTYKTYRRNAHAEAGVVDSEPKIVDKAPPPTGSVTNVATDTSDIDSHVGAFPGSFPLSTNFTLAALTTNTQVSNYALKAQCGLTEKQIVANLRALCLNVLEPMKTAFGSAMKINSGFRHGQGTSQHYKGQAADVSFTDCPTSEASFNRAKQVQNQFNFDQYIYEQNNSIWHHVSYNTAGCRRNVLSKPRGDRYLAGLVKIVV